MEKLRAKERPLLFTVGHSNHSLNVFVELLQRHGIQFLVDTRSHPYSKYLAHFNREALSQALSHSGIKYLYLGKELGGRPEGEEFYDDDGHVLYYRLAESPLFLNGIDRLTKGIQGRRLAIMCSEEDPSVCHRHLLVGRVMAERGARICHLRGDGAIQDDSDRQVTESKQLLLFDQPEDNTWKSLRSVLRRKQPSNSSIASEAMESDDWSMFD